MVSRRVVTSYKARYGLNPESKARINNVTDAIDVHAHARGITVDAYRLLARLLRAYGVNETEMQTMMVDSPRELLAL
jgi:predicted metal-dependent phosphotriesterase family hydrolase